MNAEKFTTFIDLLKNHEDSERTALICGEERLTYRELILDAKQIARALAEEGVKKGDRVLFCMRRSADAIRGVLGIIYAGGVFIAADPDWPEERLRFITEDADAVFFMTDEGFQKMREKTVDEKTPLPHLEGEDEISIIFTSGSTGEPKGAALRHKQYGAEIMGQTGFGCEKQDWERFQIIVKFSYVNAFEDCFKILAMHKTILLSAEKELTDVDALGTSMEKNKADAISGTPSMILRFLETPSFAKAFHNIRQVLFYGEKVTLSTIEKIRKVTDADIYIGYGCSEMMNCAKYHYRNDGKLFLGNAEYGVQRYILNENMKEVGPGEEGELFIGGEPARLGYYVNRPELNAEKYLEHPVYGRLFRMGDIVRIHENGELTVVGRKDGMVKLRGQRIETAEVEKRIEHFPGIRRAAVKLTGTSPKEALACWYTVSEEISETDLRWFLANQLPYYMVPTLFMQLSAMPENEHGKLNYRALPEIEIQDQEYSAPETKEEKLLCALFQEVLKSDDPVSAEDSFFALGGDSIQAMEVSSRLKKKGYTFPLRLIFTSPTARALAPLLVPVDEERDEMPEYSYALSDGQRKAIESRVGLSNIECVYPVTWETEKRLRNNRPWMQYQMYEIPADLFTKESFLQKIKELTEKHVVLRSVFCFEEGEEALQVVRKSHEPKCFFVDLRRLSKGAGLSAAQKAYFRNLIRIESEQPKDLKNDVVFEAGLIRISETVSMLFFCYSHLLLDGASISHLVREITEPMDVQPDRMLWNRRMNRFYQIDAAASMDYWKKLLEGCEGITRLPVKREDTELVSPNSFYAPESRKFYEEITDYLKPHQLTMAALVHFAFGRALMEVLNTDDVCFYSVTNGRTAEEMEMTGMLATRFPVRLLRTDSPADCQAQLLSSVGFADHWVAYDLGDQLLKGECTAILDIQNFFEDFQEGCSKIDVMKIAESLDQMQQLMRQMFPTVDREEWHIVVNTADQFSAWHSFNGNRYDAALLRRIHAGMVRQLQAVIKGELE